MKIILLCGYYYPDTIGGTEAYVRTLGRHLQEKGHKVKVAAPSGEETTREYVHDELPVFRYPVSQSPTRKEVQGEQPPEFLDDWTSWITDEQPDILHAHSLTRGCNAYHMRAARRQDIAILFTVHLASVTCPRGTLMRWGDTPCDGEIRPVRCGACLLQAQNLPKSLAVATSLVSRTGIGRYLPGRTGSLLQKTQVVHSRKKRMQKWMSQVDRLVVVADWLREVLARNGIDEGRVSVSRHGLSERMRSMQEKARERRVAPDPEDTLRLGFVGRFYPIKGLHVLAEAVCELEDRVDVAVDVYGTTQGESDASYLRSVKERAASEERIRFRGELNSENRVDAFASFDILAVPSVGFETGPFTVLEAFASGIPVIGTNQGGIAERVEHGTSGVLVPPDDVAAWTDAILSLYEQHRNGAWDWSVPAPRSSLDVAEEMEELYARCMK